MILKSFQLEFHIVNHNYLWVLVKDTIQILNFDYQEIEYLLQENMISIQVYKVLIIQFDLNMNKEIIILHLGQDNMTQTLNLYQIHLQNLLNIILKHKRHMQV